MRSGNRFGEDGGGSREKVVVEDGNVMLVVLDGGIVIL